MPKTKDKRIGKRQIFMRETGETAVTVAMTVDEAVKKVVQIKRARNLKERTIHDYIRSMGYFSKWLNENYPGLLVHEITLDILRSYVLWCANEKVYYEGHPYKSEVDKGRRGLEASSVNVQIRVIKTFFNEMYKEGIIRVNPAANLSTMRQEIDTVKPLTEEELNRFLAAPDQRYYAQFRDYVIMMLILDTGMRINEICALEKSELDLEERRIVLPAIKNKNRRSRVLPLSVQMVRLLKKLLVETEAHFDTKYVFVTNYGEPLNEKTIQKAFSKYAAKAKLSRNVSPHVLRHNFATMAASNGMSIFHLMKILGHADIKTTRRYVQVDDADLQEQHRLYSPLTRVLLRKRG